MNRNAKRSTMSNSSIVVESGATKDFPFVETSIIFGGSNNFLKADGS